MLVLVLLLLLLFDPVVNDYLKTADMNVTTERIVLTHVQNTLSLSKPIAEYKRHVSSVIEKFLEEFDAQEAPRAQAASGDEGGAAGSSDQEYDSDGEPRAAKAKRGRKRPAGEDGATAAAKRSRSGTGTTSTDEVLYSSDLSGRRKARWARLARELPQLLAAQRAGNAAAPACQLSRTRLAAISEFRGSCYLGLREYYEKDGQLHPSKKGVNLSLAEAEALLAAAPDISVAVGGLGELLPPPSPPPQEAVATTTAAAAPPPLPPPPQAAAAPPKNGELLPGKKGIALSPADWGTLQQHMGAVDEALRRRDLAYCLKLSGMRRVSLSEFKGVTYVGVREYYDKGGGDLAPSAKGLNLNQAQWAACVAGAPAITAALQRAQQAA
ncbi:hypothetical protein VOLCADRAFT_121383 [Volvox carteri f. nagariensis]|uniref:Transcriptional coactivator p15 (PC4) C-terminal domain-containing protein n=1 Tax=Volvox carteri f. nagariensis TaxID=3068 RepID=D8U8Z1_VOLCA|nr:uncharacterized protein VOLCADRAFT_121383 [Volvox carteri f. nagariensis]EFJ43890.1 hypothetical protein VOLCADRAFT_121383 [Volvox carteri f. nagariensis]|eukprot:XP_002955136.1 hypothetical protein VOLCADRAFT_121383 [Volvox carteri f. nagariensis]